MDVGRPGRGMTLGQAALRSPKVCPAGGMSGSTTESTTPALMESMTRGSILGAEEAGLGESFTHSGGHLELEKHTLVYTWRGGGSLLLKWLCTRPGAGTLKSPRLGVWGAGRFCLLL